MRQTCAMESRMSSQVQQHYTPEEYLALERQEQCKSEYYAGEIFAMAGASRWHNLLVTNVLRELSLQLKGRPCTTYPSDMRVKVSPTDFTLTRMSPWSAAKPSSKTTSKIPY